MPVILDALTGDPNVAADAIKQDGCFVLRGAVSAEELGDLHQACLRYFKLAQDEGAEGVARATGLPISHIEGHVEGAAKRGVTHHSVLSWFLYGDPNKLELKFGAMLAQDRIRRFLTPVLGPVVLHSNNLAIRYRDVAREDLALPFHQDSFYFEPEFLGDETVMLVIWLPFTDCDLDTPGLEVVPQPQARNVPLREVANTQFQHLEAEVADDLATWYPHLKRGDCVVFAERTLHRSYPHPVKNPRTSVDLRVYTRGRYPKALAAHRMLSLDDLQPVDAPA